MTRPRKYTSNAERQRAYRERVRSLKEERLLEATVPEASLEVQQQERDLCGFRNPMVPIQKCDLPEGHLGAHRWR
jgi:hypothetical protein